MVLAIILMISFGAIVFVGSPFVRTHKVPVRTALDMLGIKEGSHLLDLGSGDGAVLLAVAERGGRATGYELNPVMWSISKWRTRRYSSQITIHWQNMWRAPIDETTENIFIFLDYRFLKRFNKKIINSKSTVSVTSYSYKIPGKKIIQTEQGVHLYEYSD